MNKPYLYILIFLSWVLSTNVIYASNWISSSDGEKPATFADLEIIFSNILGILFPIAGITLFIMIVIAGFRWMTSAGDPKGMESAKNTLTWAILGLIFLIGAWLVLVFIRQITGIDVTIFTIPK